MDKTHRKPNLLNRVDEGTEKAVLQHAIEFPAHGQLRTSNELRKREFLFRLEESPFNLGRISF
jgi:hypothetical protein